MRVAVAVLVTVGLAASASAQAPLTVSHADAHFQWDVPPYTVTEELNDAPESFVITCGALTATVPLPTDQNPVTQVRYPIADLLPTPGQYQCDLYAQNSAGRQADPNVPFPLFESGFVPGAPTTVAVLETPPPPPVIATITPLGPVQSFTDLSASGSQSITIPTGASFFAVGVSGYLSTAGYFSSGALALDGQPLSQISADANTNAFMGALFYLVSPPAGTHVLSWNWQNAPHDGVLFAWRAYSGVNTTSPIRSSSGSQQLSTPHTSSVLQAQSGDRIIAWVSAYSGGIEIPFVWTGATSVYDGTSYRNADVAWAEASPVGSQSVSVDGPKSGDTDAGIMAIVLKPAGGN